MSDWKPVSVPIHPVTYENMLACPYCSRRFPVLEHKLNREYRVHCPSCEANGSAMSNLVLALTFWNNVARADEPYVRNGILVHHTVGTITSEDVARAEGRGE